MNTIEQLYGQDCGRYNIMIQPELEFISIESSGSLHAGWAYPDQFIVSPSNQDHVGEYTIQMTVYQDLSIPGHGYTLPYEGTIPSKTFEYHIFIGCAPVLSIGEKIESINYIIGDPSFKFDFSFVQTPDCGHEGHAELVASSEI